MHQLIVPALPLERSRYERAYVLGLEAMMAIIQQLVASKSDQQALTDQFPVFEVSYDVPHANKQVATIKAAVANSKVQPIRISVTRRQVTLQFMIQIPNSKPVWAPSAGALWRLYDGFLSNLTGVDLPDIVAVHISLESVISSLTVTVPVRPSFQNYGIQAPTKLQVSCLEPGQILPPVPAQRAIIYQLGQYLSATHSND
ncbi:hypothetical protein RXV91_06900 [Lactiplantibacillus sp. DA1]|uniref:hypothetical protein n=1 Tax=Lactiplantibacillus sp. DA1 TaxID=3079857 RepID=UPI00292A6394|nr:hypothetical protein [Lactiplantibacillus sp. DA1]MDV0430605.1 hypothetical protein [Lactiplantibacillus sp. DA1]